jgi:putative ABC transport system permease protein
MTVLGVAVGISIFVSLTSFSKGYKSQLEDMIRSYSIDLILMSKGAATPFGSRIPLSDYQALLTIEGIRNVSSVIMGSTTSTWNPYLLLIGFSSFDSLSSKIGIVEGRVFRPGKKEILLGEVISRRLDLHVNDTISLAGGEAFTVSGIYISGSRTFDGGAIVDLRDAQKMLSREDTVNMVFIQIIRGRDPKEVMEKIQNRLPGVTAMRGGEFVGEIRMIRIVEASTWTVSLISFITCCIVVMNTILMTVRERIKEFGILMAIGWSRFRIIRTILLEAILICMMGGILGNLFGMVLLWCFSYINPEGLGWWVTFTTHPDVFLQSIGLSLLLGAISSYYPGQVITKMLPSEALRYE